MGVAKALVAAAPEAAANWSASPIATWIIEHGGEGLGPVRLGIAPHLGEVTFGNIGAPGRLDFTVIGRAVNEVSRVDALCASLDRLLLTSAGFAESCGAIFSSRWAPTFCAG